MNDDRLADLLFELLSGEVTISDNQPDFSDWKYLIDNGLVEHSKPKGSVGTRAKTITFRRLTEAGKQKLDSLEAQ
ncbi:hypothetical protein AB833_13665 [Chromatiales bacterium (ex Bugula neritina AB1)]|nr:hypothetical protein AB833_13665 [Chromatiales bacterium (ex Bugula neritina AB1)]